MLNSQFESYSYHIRINHKKKSLTAIRETIPSHHSMISYRDWYDTF